MISNGETFHQRAPLRIARHRFSHDFTESAIRVFTAPSLVHRILSATPTPTTRTIDRPEVDHTAVRRTFLSVKNARRTFLSVKNPAKRCFFTPSQPSKSTEIALSQLLSSASFRPARKKSVFSVLQGSARTGETSRPGIPPARPSQTSLGRFRSPPTRRKLVAIFQLHPPFPPELLVF
jgi:hypothetical protein